ncbi:hypothetical protein CBR_g6737 [Chara braunii]|uniref:Uncharacterized protein n=1 Tax=Chara braunii TaxID=69332 RepID=A0A388KKM8_CHABU|nr:hypothetical protein CBR_g6737 [Chara braunii]|eukprot:GBG70610.1 hypothetical protein CBR_g6737 [Chara braunii]
MNTSAQVATCTATVPKCHVTWTPNGNATWTPKCNATWALADASDRVGRGSIHTAEPSSSRSRGIFCDVSRRASGRGRAACHVSRRRLVAIDEAEEVRVRQLALPPRHRQLTRRVRAAPGDSAEDQKNGDEESSASGDPDSLESELAAKIAAMEAEAKALRAELARRAGKEGADIDLAKLQPQRPEKRIDGTGYRETLMSGPGRPFTGDAATPSPDKWGLSEAQLFLTRGGPSEGDGLAGPAIEEGAEGIVQRRLLIGVSLTVTAVALAFVKNPFGRTKPAKPLFLYLAPVVSLFESLKALQDYGEDASKFQVQLKRVLGSTSSLRENLLSAASALENDADSEAATSLAFEALDFLNQADYSQYFDNRGEPSLSQLLEFSRFSFQSVTEASNKLQAFLALMPAEAVSAARDYLQRDLSSA